jgi:predicted phosphodiesterase
VHATPRDPLYRYLEPEPAAWERELEQVAADVLLVGHAHLQFRIEVAGRTIVNPGSVGQRRTAIRTPRRP